MRVDTGSGGLRLTGWDLVEFGAETGSSEIVLEMYGGRPARVNADTGRGDVTLRLAPDMNFEALADPGSGDISVRFPDAAPVLRRREVIGYPRGEVKKRISVNAGSGSLLIEPARQAACPNLRETLRR